MLKQSWAVPTMEIMNKGKMYKLIYMMSMSPRDEAIRLNFPKWYAVVGFGELSQATNNQLFIYQIPILLK